jgi:hypothetical protein
VALCVAGCQSNADRDLIARDRRMQEDQMWAMQDYIQQYQQLVCQFRSENASLRRQLNDDRSGAVVEPQPTPRMPVSPPKTNRAPNLPYSPPAGIEKKQNPSPNIEMPDVPPLNQGTSIDANSWYRAVAVHDRGKANLDRYAQPASYETPVDGAPPPAASEPAALDVPTTAASPDILLSGEVVANDGGGPRLSIDLESFDHSGRIARFDGNVSLALIASEGGVQRRLARWDFGPDDVRSAVDATASEPTMRFHVELPAGTRVDGATELWAKLAPTNGSRLFSHAKLNLTKPGVFSSRTDKVWASEESVVAASYVDTPTQPAEIAPSTNESTWATAKPGKPEILLPESDEATGGWKAASGPLPAVAESTKSTATVRAESPKSIEPASAKTGPVEVARKPSWTPERSGTQSRAARPNWSATR